MAFFPAIQIVKAKKNAFEGRFWENFAPILINFVCGYESTECI